MCYNRSMSDDNQEVDGFGVDGPPFVKGIVPGTMSGAEMLAYWEESGCFEVWAEQYKDIGPGKKYADSTEYVNARRGQATEERSRRHHG